MGSLKAVPYGLNPLNVLTNLHCSRILHQSVRFSSVFEMPVSVVSSIVPVVMAGVLGIYGLIIAVIIGQGIEYKNYSGKSSSMGLKPQLSLISC